MSFILSNYFIANLDRDIHPEVYDWEKFDEYIAGGYWLKEQVAYYKNCIEKELEKEDESRLLNQTIEHSHGLTYETVKDAWQTIAGVFQKAIEDEND